MKYTLIGNTYAVKETLKRKGWKYSAQGKCWTKEADDFGVGKEAAKAVDGNIKGCLLQSEYAPGYLRFVWQSKEYAATNSTTPREESRDAEYWHSVNGVPSHKDLRDDPDFL